MCQGERTGEKTQNLKYRGTGTYYYENGELYTREYIEAIIELEWKD